MDRGKDDGYRRISAQQEDEDHDGAAGINSTPPPRDRHPSHLEPLDRPQSVPRSPSKRATFRTETSFRRITDVNTANSPSSPPSPPPVAKHPPKRQTSFASKSSKAPSTVKTKAVSYKSPIPKVVRGNKTRLELEELVSKYNGSYPPTAELGVFWKSHPTDAHEIIELLVDRHRRGKVATETGEYQLLSLEQCELSSIPPSTYELKDLRWLSLGRNDLSSLPDGLSRLQSLKVFFIDNNKFESVPEELEELHHTLEMFSICDNELTSVPPFLGRFSELHTLYLSNNELTSVPKELKNCRSLGELYLHGNHLTEIPAELSELQKLKTLDVSHNDLQELPSSLGQMSSLAELYASDNKLTKLGSFCLRLPHLYTLVLKGNETLLDPPCDASSPPVPPGFVVMLQDCGVYVQVDDALKVDETGNTGLHYCAGVRGDDNEETDSKLAMELAERIVKASKDVQRSFDAINNEGQTALHSACRAMNPELAVYYVKRGVNVNQVDVHGFVAAEYIGHEGVRTFRHQHPFFADKIGKLYKERAVDSRSEAILLLEATRDPAKFGRYGFPNEVAQAFYNVRKHGLEVFLKSVEFVSDSMAGAVMTPRNEERRAIEVVPQPSQQDNDFFSSNSSSKQTTEAGGGGEDDTLDDTPMSMWVSQLKLVKGMLREKAGGGYEVFPLHTAVVKAHEGTVKELIEGGAELDKHNEFGQTPIHIAATSGHEGVLEMCLDTYERVSLSQIKKEKAEKEKEKKEEKEKGLLESDLERAKSDNKLERDDSRFSLGGFKRMLKIRKDETEDEEIDPREKVNGMVTDLVNKHTNPPLPVAATRSDNKKGLGGWWKDHSEDVEVISFSPLFLAIKSGMIRTSELLIDYGADVSEKQMSRKGRSGGKPYYYYENITAHDVALHCLSEQRKLLQIAESTASNVDHVEPAVETAKRVVEALSEHPKVRRERHQFARVYFCTRMVFYSVFLIALTMLAVDMTGDRAMSDRLAVKTAVEQRLGETEFPETSTQIEKAFEDISDPGEFWDFVNHPLTEGLFPDEDVAGNGLEGDDQLVMDGQFNRLLGSIRFRQLRSRVTPCSGHVADLQSPTCVRTYKADEDREPFGPEHKWVWRSQHDVRGIKTRMPGRFSDHYHGGGFVVDIPADAAAWATAIADLQENKFIDRQTRVLFITLNHININNNLIIATHYMVEFPATGGFFPSQEYKVLSVELETEFDDNVMIIELFVSFMVVAFALEELRELFAEGFKEYFANFWNYVDGMTNVAFVSILVLRFLTRQELQALNFSIDEPELFRPVDMAILYQDREREIMSVMVLLSWFRVLKYGEYLPGIGSLVMAVTSTIRSSQVVVFLTFMFLVIVAFIFGHYAAFRGETVQYYSITNTAMTLTKMLFGEFPEILNHHVMEVIMFALTMVIVVLILLNLFIGVLSDVYSEISSRSTKVWNDVLTDRMAQRLQYTGSTKLIDFSRLRRLMRSLSCGLLRWKRGKLVIGMVNKVKPSNQSEDVESEHHTRGGTSGNERLEEDDDIDWDDFMEDVGFKTRDPFQPVQFPVLSKEAVDKYSSWLKDNKMGSLEVRNELEHRVDELESAMEGRDRKVQEQLDIIQDTLLHVLKQTTNGHDHNSDMVPYLRTPNGAALRRRRQSSIRATSSLPAASPNTPV